MSTRPFLKILTFVAASAIVGLAAAFDRRGGAPGAHRTAPARPAATAPAAKPAPAAPASSLPLANPEAAQAPPPRRELLRRSRGARRPRRRQHLHGAHRQGTFRPNPIEELFGDVRPRVRQRLEQSLGSGVIVDEEGHVITNHHVIEKADADPCAAGRRPYRGRQVVGRDPDTDLAVLQLDLKKNVP